MNEEQKQYLDDLLSRMDNDSAFVEYICKYGVYGEHFKEMFAITSKIQGEIELPKYFADLRD